MTELDYKERATNFSTTNTVLFGTTGVGGADPVIGNLDCTVVGTGAPVEVEFNAPAMASTTGQLVTSYFVVTKDGGPPAVTAALSNYKNWASPYGTGGTMRRRLVLANGSTYRFQVGLSAPSGITTACGQATNPGTGVSTGVMSLRVTD